MNINNNKVGSICDNTNLRLCRLAGTIENHGCDYYSIPSGTEPVMIDVGSIVISVIAFLVFVLFHNHFKDYELAYENQRATRGKWMYRVHLYLMGISALMWGIESSFFVIDGTALHVFIALRYVFLDAAEVLLFFIGLLDSQVIPSSPIMLGIAITLSIGTGCVCLGFFSESFAQKAVGVFGIGIPFGCALAHFLAMLIVCLVRKIYLGIGYAALMLLTNVLPLVLELFANAPLCSSSNGAFTGSTLGLLIFLFYRVFITLFYPILKKSEKNDGLGSSKKLLKRDGEEDSDVPAIIDIDDYEYEYTYSEVSMDD